MFASVLLVPWIPLLLQSEAVFADFAVHGSEGRTCRPFVDDHMDDHGEQPGPTPGGGAGRSENLQGGVQRRARSVQGWCPEEGYRAGSLPHRC